MATRSIRPVTLMFSRSLVFKNVRPKILYLPHASAEHWHSICIPAQSAFLPLCESELKHLDSKGCVLWKLPHSPWSFCLLIAWSSFVLLGRGSRIRALDWKQPLQVSHLFRCCYLKWLLMTFPPFNIILLSVPGQWVSYMVSSLHGHKTKPIYLMTYIYCHYLSTAN